MTQPAPARAPPSRSRPRVLAPASASPLPPSRSRPPALRSPPWFPDPRAPALRSPPRLPNPRTQPSAPSSGPHVLGPSPSPLPRPCILVPPAPGRIRAARAGSGPRGGSAGPASPGPSTFAPAQDPAAQVLQQNVRRLLVRGRHPCPGLCAGVWAEQPPPPQAQGPRPAPSLRP